MPETFVLYRILGNDLPPRHGARQTIANLAFILDNEPAFPGCEKRWVVNRIADPAREAELVAMLAERGQRVLHIPFDLDAYARVMLDADGLPPDVDALGIASGTAQPAGVAHLAFEWIYRHKNRYAVNVNGARNAAVVDGLMSGARWIMPWDGACFLTAAAFQEIAQLAQRSTTARFLVIPMARSHDNAELLAPGYRPRELPDEPQVVFRSDAADRFDENLRYGHLSKAELLRRLGVPGPWQNWGTAKWEGYRPPPTENNGRFAMGAWVARLDPGASGAVESDASSRWRSRFDGLAAHCAMLDRRVVATHRADGDGLICYGPLLAAIRPDGPQAAAIVAAARGFLGVAPPTVIAKPELPPGVGRNDYVSIRRYVHEEAGGRWVTRDGVPNPAAVRGGEGADRYDRFRWQALADGVTAMALAARLTGEQAFAGHAAAWVCAWLVDPATRMNPHIRFAQVIPGRSGEVALAGMVDFRDLWAVSDAIRILRNLGALGDADTAALRAWFAALRDDLLSRRERTAALANNLGVFHDVLLAAAAAAAEDDACLATVLARAPLRLGRQLAPWGWQPAETSRTLPLHYVLFAAQGMIALAAIGRACGIDLWQYDGAWHRSIPMALRFAAQNRTQFADYAPAAARFDDRIAAALRLVPADAADRAAIADLPPRAIADVRALDATDGFAPWMPLLLASAAELEARN